MEMETDTWVGWKVLGWVEGGSRGRVVGRGGRLEVGRGYRSEIVGHSLQPIGVISNWEPIHQSSKVRSTVDAIGQCY